MKGTKAMVCARHIVLHASVCPAHSFLPSCDETDAILGPTEGVAVGEAFFLKPGFVCAWEVELCMPLAFLLEIKERLSH